jgi:hypothetical protein
MHGGTVESSGSPAGKTDSLVWTTRVRRPPVRLAVALMIVALVAWFGISVAHNVFIAVVGAVAVLSAIVETLFPVHCSIDGTGVSTRCAWQMRVLAWKDVRSVRHGEDGVHLSPLQTENRFSLVRGVTLRYSEDNASDVLSLIRRYYVREPDSSPTT